MQKLHDRHFRYSFMVMGNQEEGESGEGISEEEWEGGEEKEGQREGE